MLSVCGQCCNEESIFKLNRCSQQSIYLAHDGSLPRSWFWLATCVMEISFETFLITNRRHPAINWFCFLFLLRLVFEFLLYSYLNLFRHYFKSSVKTLCGLLHWHQSLFIFVCRDSPFSVLKLSICQELRTIFRKEKYCSKRTLTHTHTHTHAHTHTHTHTHTYIYIYKGATKWRNEPWVRI
jgi:hypothetical protein